jgi:hypothetical protein
MLVKEKINALKNAFCEAKNGVEVEPVREEEIVTPTPSDLVIAILRRTSISMRYLVKSEALHDMTDEAIVQACRSGHNWGFDVKRYNNGSSAEVVIYID